MNPNAEKIEQCAQVCYEAQRALLMSRGLAALNQAVPAAWCVAPDSDKHAARAEVARLWPLTQRSAGPAFEKFENSLAFAIVKAAAQREGRL